MRRVQARRPRLVRYLPLHHEFDEGGQNADDGPLAVNFTGPLD